MQQFRNKKIFNWLDNSELDVFFEGNKHDSHEIITLNSKLYNHILENTKSYPYSSNIKIISIKEPSESTGNIRKQRSFWETFIDELLKTRHGIAHGSTTENRLSTEDLLDFRTKVTTLEHSVLLILTYKVIKERMLENELNINMQ